MELTPGYKQTDLGVIPADWDTPLLDSIAKRGSGHTPDKKHPEYWNGSISWVSLKDSDSLDTLYIEETAATITPEGIANSSAVLHPAGTVVLSRDAGVGKSAIMKRAMAVSQHFMAWQCSSNLDNVFLYYSLQAAKPEFERIAMGSTIKTIGLPFFRSFRITKPPLQEQRAIAAALSDVDALLAKLDQLIAKKRDLKQATMQQLLTGQTRLPGFSGAWSSIRMSKHASLKARIGWQALTTAEYMDEGEYYLVTGTDFIGGRINWASCQYVDQWRYDQDRNIQLRDGDVLLTKDGTIGKVGYVDGLSGPATLNSGVFVIRPLQESFFPLFLFYTLRSKVFDEFLAMITAGSTIVHLYQKDFVTFEFLAPSIEEQTAIATVLSDMDTELAALVARRDKTRALKQGMMQELLTGRIRLV